MKTSLALLVLLSAASAAAADLGYAGNDDCRIALPARLGVCAAEEMKITARFFDLSERSRIDFLDLGKV